MRLAAIEGNDILRRTSNFSRRIMRLCDALPKTTTGQKLASQLFCCGTSIGAQLSEANFAKSQADFISKLEGALQEAQETRYWLELLRDGEIVKSVRLEAILREISEIIAIIVTIIHKSRPKQ